MKKIPCEACRESGGDRTGDNMVMYDDGHGYCYACGAYIHGDGVETPAPPPKADGWTPLKGRLMAIQSRGITTESCQRFGYKIAKVGGKIHHVAPYYKGGRLVGQKVRDEDKNFRALGDLSGTELFGQHLWKNGGRSIVVTEGEIDALSAYEMMGRKWPVVSVPHGAAGAAKSFRENLEFLSGYEKVVINFDNDEAGQKAALECAALLPPGVAHIMTTPLKDANEHLVKGERAVWMSCFWEAKAYRPDGIIHARDVRVSQTDMGEVYDWPWPTFNKALLGRRSGELVVHTSGSGMGKSTVLREMILADLLCGENVGVLMLEESVQDTMHDLMSLLLNKPIRRIMASRKINQRREAKGLEPIDFDVVDNLTDDEYHDAKLSLAERGLYLYDHFGSQDVDTLVSRLEYMAVALECPKLYLDHISIVISGMDSGNERKDIDLLMTTMRSFVERTDVHIDAVCHLIKPQSRPFEEGGQISLRDLRGSGALYQLADSVIGYERNQQSTDEYAANTIMVRSLKDRFSGKTGLVSALHYDTTTGRLQEVDFRLTEDGEIVLNGQDMPSPFTPEFVEDELENIRV